MSLVTTAVIQLTRRCNLDCDHCYTAPLGAGRDPTLSAELYRGLLDDLRGCGARSVSLVGGEPFLLPDLPQRIAEAVERGFRPDLVTNGAPATERKLAACASAGLEKLVVSIDGLEGSHDAMRGRGSFRAARGALERGRGLGLDVRVNTVVTQRNVHEVPSLVAALSDACDAHKLIYYTPSGRSGLSDWLSPSVWFRFVGELRASLPEGSRHPVFVQQPWTDVPVAETCDLRAPFVGADGQVFPCVLLFDTPHAVGTLRERTFASIWTGDWPLRRGYGHCIGYGHHVGTGVEDRLEGTPLFEGLALGCMLSCNKPAGATAARLEQLRLPGASE